jgi:hypothetical protein
MTTGAASAVKSAEYPHTVVFYNHEQSLGRTVAEFLAPGLGHAAAAIVIASPSRQPVILNALVERGLNVEDLKAAGDLQIVDSDRLLERIMSGADPNPARFRAAVDELIDRSCRRRQGWPVRAYGDAVDLLWQRGNPEGAIRLEVLWNRSCGTGSRLQRNSRCFARKPAAISRSGLTGARTDRPSAINTIRSSKPSTD